MERIKYEVQASKAEPWGVGITLRFEIKRRKWTPTFGLKSLSVAMVFISCIFLFIATASQANFDKKAYYNSLYLTDITLVNQQLKLLSNSTIKDKDAFEGALLMKKAELVKEKKEKLDLFKSGKNKLEAAILKDSKNCEYRFLRIIIQEHAPKILKYHTDLTEDSKFVKNNFSSNPEMLKKLIQEYSKSSLYLKL